MPILCMKSYIEKEIDDLQNEVFSLKEEKQIIPKLFILTDGVDERCKTYMKSKLNYSTQIGIETTVKTVKDISDLQNVLEYCDKNNIPTIMQLPIEKSLERYYNESNIARKIDVDGFFTYQDLFERDWSNAPCTALGIMNYILDQNGLDIDTRDKHIAILGRGNLCGMPLAIMATPLFGTTSVITSRTNPYIKKQILKTADIIVLATGVKGSVKMSELPSHKNIIVINVGTMFDENGKLTTELDVDAKRENVFYTDRIKAVGILTVLSLMLNVINFYKK